MTRHAQRNMPAVATCSVPAVPTICIVDARPEDFGPWVSAAADAGVRLEFCGTAAAALQRARQQQVDLWVVNATLPGLSGTELCRMLKAQSGHNVVYLVADDYAPAIEQEARVSRANLFECKPLPPSRLGDWLAHWRFKRRRETAPCSSNFGASQLAGRS